MSTNDENGPIYNVPLLDSLPLGDGVMRQALPCREDLEAAAKVSERVVAGYEVLLSHYRETLRQVAELRAELERANKASVARSIAEHPEKLDKLRERLENEKPEDWE